MNGINTITIPVSQARSQLGRLLGKMDKNKMIYISRQNQTKAVLVAPSYLASLERQVQANRLEEIMESAQKKFLSYAQKSLGKKKISEKEAYHLLTGKSLSLWHG